MKAKEFERYRVRPQEKIALRGIDPADTGAYGGSKAEGLEAGTGLCAKLGRLQELLYAGHQHKVLVVLQGTDTSGKDGVIRHVFQGVNPQGVKVHGFKSPTPEELDHDFLWRVHRCVPGKGEIAIFNRSHYEDVLIVRVHGLVPPEIWKSRYDSINAFEQMLVREGTTILKFYLHVSQGEQKKRLQDRLDDPEKRWKFNPGDLPERRLWAEYEKAYEDVLSRTSTYRAPWYVIPSDKKWYRNLAVAAILVRALEDLRMKYPASDFDPAKMAIR